MLAHISLDLHATRMIEKVHTVRQEVQVMTALASLSSRHYMTLAKQQIPTRAEHMHPPWRISRERTGSLHVSHATLQPWHGMPEIDLMDHVAATAGSLLSTASCLSLSVLIYYRQSLPMVYLAQGSGGGPSWTAVLPASPGHGWSERRPSTPVPHVLDTTAFWPLAPWPLPDALSAICVACSCTTRCNSDTSYGESQWVWDRAHRHPHHRLYPQLHFCAADGWPDQGRCCSCYLLLAEISSGWDVATCFLSCWSMAAARARCLRRTMITAAATRSTPAAAATLPAMTAVLSGRLDGLMPAAVGHSRVGWCGHCAVQWPGRA